MVKHQQDKTHTWMEAARGQTLYVPLTAYAACAVAPILDGIFFFSLEAFMGLMAMTVLPHPNTAHIYEAYLTGGRSGGAGTSIIHASLHVCEGEIVCLCESVCSQTTPARDGFHIPTSIYLNKREREIEISVKSTQLKYKNKGLKLK